MSEKKHKRGRKSYKKGRKNKRNQQEQPAEDNRQPSGGAWVSDAEMKSEIFEKYYRLQEILDSEEEYQQLFSILKTNLPITFRINPTDSVMAEAISKRIQTEFLPLFKEQKEIHDKQVKENAEKPAETATTTSAEGESSNSSQKFDNEPFEIPENIPWINDNLGWKLTIGKRLFRKLPALKVFRDYLMHQTEIGNISRQEAVSMLPPLFFEDFMKPSDRILDMCAAPGSKTAQLMEMLLASSQKTNTPITGFVVANDNDMKRCFMLSHQLHRLSSILPYTLITNHDAMQYPSVTKFDKILCDVMCTGDGTLRKAPDLWKRWKPGLAWDLHKMQIKVTMRAFQLLEVGGIIVYSTCSINPIEDEACVAEILRQSKGCLELIDCSKKFGENFKYSPGRPTWKFVDNEGMVHPNFESTQSTKFAEKIQPSMFPPTEEEAKTMNLHYTMRVLPHRQDSGGFFVAVLRKTKDIKELKQKKLHVAPAEATTTTTASAASEAPASPAEETTTAEKPAGEIRAFRGRKHLEIEKIISPPSQSLDEVFEHYGIDEAQFSKDNFVIRTLDENKRSQKLYYICKEAREIIRKNEQKKNFNVVSVGIRMFDDTDLEYCKTKYRITNEGAAVLYKALSPKVIVELNKEDFMKALQHNTIDCRTFEEESRKKLEEAPFGGIIFSLKGFPAINFAALRVKSGAVRQVSKDDSESLQEKVNTVMP